MSDTFNEFVKFISDDPLMLGLCIAVIILIFIFIIVLCFGGKKKKKVEETSNVEENTTQLLAADLNEEPLRSTQEFNLSKIQEEQKSLEKTINVPDVESINETLVEKEAPISIDEAMNLKSSREENEVKDTIEIPVVNDTSSVELEIPSTPIIPEIQAVDTTPEIAPIIPEVNSEVEEIELPSMTREIPKVEVTSATQPFSSVYVNSGDELPKVNDDFSKTDIIKHVPVMEDAELPEPVMDNAPVIEIPVVEPKVETVNSFDDLDLPKLNNDEETSVLSTLTGESFNIK